MEGTNVETEEGDEEGERLVEERAKGEDVVFSPPLFFPRLNFDFLYGTKGEEEGL
jgi:hypothetical protein